MRHDELPLIVAYYGIDTPYREIAERLRVSVQELNLEHEIRAVPDLGTWGKMTHFKATFLHNMRQEFPGRTLLYVDADALVQQVPEFLRGFQGDIAVRYQDFGYRKNECLSGTVCLGPGPAVDELMLYWIRLNDHQEGIRNKVWTYEQRHLQQAMLLMGKRIDFTLLPPEYCFIRGTMTRMYRGAKPVIEHLQASRKHANRRSPEWQ